MTRYARATAHKIHDLHGRFVGTIVFDDAEGWWEARPPGRGLTVDAPGSFGRFPSGEAAAAELIDPAWLRERREREAAEEEAASLEAEREELRALGVIK